MDHRSAETKNSNTTAAISVLVIRSYYSGDGAMVLSDDLGETFCLLLKLLKVHSILKIFKIPIFFY